MSQERLAIQITETSDRDHGVVIYDKVRLRTMCPVLSEPDQRPPSMLAINLLTLSLRAASRLIVNSEATMSTVSIAIAIFIYNSHMVVVAFRPLGLTKKLCITFEPRLVGPISQSRMGTMCHVSQFDQLEVFCLPIPR